MEGESCNEGIKWEEGERGDGSYGREYWEEQLKFREFLKAEWKPNAVETS